MTGFDRRRGRRDARRVTPPQSERHGHNLRAVLCAAVVVLGGFSATRVIGRSLHEAPVERGRSAGGRSTVGPIVSRARIAAIALSQVGVGDLPAVTNYNSIDCDPFTTMVGPWYPDPDDRGCGYSASFGVEEENEEWCADFAEWVWMRAGVTENLELLNPGAKSFYRWGLAEHEPLIVDAEHPAVGDAVVFYPPGPIDTQRVANHVGLVVGLGPGGTVDLVNGDFSGGPDIGVEDDPGVDLAAFAASVFGPGEQWVLVSPPTTPQPPVPVVHLLGPHVVEADTAVAFTAPATEVGGAIRYEQWAFGDGEYTPDGTARGSSVLHVFADAGRTTVTVIARSNRGTIAVATLTLEVLSSSSSVVSTPSDALYYADTPVEQRLFVPRTTGGIAEESYDGSTWLDQDLPGDVAPSSPVAALSYKDAADVLEPHVFARSERGTLLELVRGPGSWSARTLPGLPAPNSPIVAATVVSRPPLRPPAAAGAGDDVAVFFLTSSGRVAETELDGPIATTEVLPIPVTTHPALGIGTFFAGGTALPVLYSLTPTGSLVISVELSSGWVARTIPLGVGVASTTTLAGGSAGIDGAVPEVFFVDRAGDVAEASPATTGPGWIATPISDVAVAPSTALLVSEHVVAPGDLVTEVAAIGASGSPQLMAATDDVVAPAGEAELPSGRLEQLGLGQHLVLDQRLGQFSTTVLAQHAVALAGFEDEAVPGRPQRLFLVERGGEVAVDVSGAAGAVAGSGSSPAPGGWSSAPELPSSPLTASARVLLYAATSSSEAAARAAATTAGLSPSQVTGSFALAWDAALSGDYLVIAVGRSATDALVFNRCGWANPSDAFGDSTPFETVGPPLTGPPGADRFEEAAGEFAEATEKLATILAVDAADGHLPAAAAGLSTEVAPANVCSGQPSVGS
jgi:hypothetical protein